MQTENSALLEVQFENIEQQRETSALGMWLFLASEIMFFGGLFLAYCVYRHLHPQSFTAASSRLNWMMGSINTVVLLSSSLTAALAVRAASLRQAGAVRVFLFLTVILGAAFLTIKGFEYHADYQEGLIPGASFSYTATQLDVQPREVEMFFMLYFIMTGVHAFHMIIGIVSFIILISKSLRNSLTVQTVENVCLYWHFVDVLWIFLFPLLYLVGHH
jgi:cytochrome c oxidase subunit 3